MFDKASLFEHLRCARREKRHVTTSAPWRQLLSALGRHFGVFLLLFGGMWLLVHFLRLSPTLLYTVPALYFVYLGAILVLASRKRKRTTTRKRK